MIKIFKEKEKQRAAEAKAALLVKKESAAELCLNRDISELNLPACCSINFVDGKDNLMNFEVTIKPDEGYYTDGTFLFSVQVPPVYPHEPPKVKCKTMTYHPNIDLDGNVCLNILREDWKPVLNINTVIYGLYNLFTQPNHEDPLNQEAADDLRDDPKKFGEHVRISMEGGYVGYNWYDSIITKEDNGEEAPESSKDENGEEAPESSKDENGEEAPESSKDENGEEAPESSKDENGEQVPESSKEEKSEEVPESSEAVPENSEAAPETSEEAPKSSEDAPEQA